MATKRKLEETFSAKNSVSVISGILEDDYSFTWKIENFEVIKSSKDLIDKQYFLFEAGESHGYPTKWRCELEESSQLKTIGISLSLLKAPPRANPMVSYSFQSMMSNGQPCKVLSERRKSFRPSTRLISRGFGFIPENEETFDKLLCEDGSIVIKVDFKLFIGKPGVLTTQVTNLQKLVGDFEKKELGNLSEMMIGMMEGGGGKPNAGKIIKVVAKDKEELWANTALLSARSPVFKAMFDSGNWREGHGSSSGGGGGGSLVLEDLSGKTVKVLLRYLHGGVLLKDDWMAEDVIVELTYAAEKYQLDNFTEFLDKALPEITFSGTEVMAKLALLAKRLDMKNAEKELFAKLKEAAVDIDELLLDKGGSLLGDN